MNSSHFGTMDVTGTMTKLTLLARPLSGPHWHLPVCTATKLAQSDLTILRTGRSAREYHSRVPQYADSYRTSRVQIARIVPSTCDISATVRRRLTSGVSIMGCVAQSRAWCAYSCSASILVLRVRRSTELRAEDVLLWDAPEAPMRSASVGKTVDPVGYSVLRILQ